jgi:hypothetical protein
VPLNISPAGSQVLIQWPNSLLPGQLESSSQLPGAGLWSPVSNGPFVIGDSNAVFLTPSNRTMLFRGQQ